MTPLLYSSYNLFIPFFLYALLLSALIFIASYSLVPRKEDKEKLTPYECGFDPFEDTRNTFDVKFYLVAILCIIFDLEIVFLFRLSISLFHINLFGYLIVVFFLIILTIGFFYEWALGALDWQ